jgi:hypothetical protein
MLIFFGDIYKEFFKNQDQITIDKSKYSINNRT